jgi:hypothetical protein
MVYLPWCIEQQLAVEFSFFLPEIFFFCIVSAPPDSRYPEVNKIADLLHPLRFYVHQGCVLGEGLPHPVAVLPLDVEPWDCYPAEGCQGAPAHPGNLGEAQSKALHWYSAVTECRTIHCCQYKQQWCTALSAHTPNQSKSLWIQLHLSKPSSAPSLPEL